MFFFMIQSFIFPGITVIIDKKKGTTALPPKNISLFYFKSVVKFIITNSRTEIINTLMAKDLLFNNIANFPFQNIITNC